MGKASAFAASARATRPASGSCTVITASVTTSPASDSEGSCVEVSNKSNGKNRDRRMEIDFRESRVTAMCREGWV